MLAVQPANVRASRAEPESCRLRLCSSATYSLAVGRRNARVIRAAQGLGKAGSRAQPIASAALQPVLTVGVEVPWHGYLA